MQMKILSLKLWFKKKKWIVWQPWYMNIDMGCVRCTGCRQPHLRHDTRGRPSRPTSSPALALRYTHSELCASMNELGTVWLANADVVHVCDPSPHTYFLILSRKQARRDTQLTGRRPCPPPSPCPCRWWPSSYCRACVWCTWAGHSGAGRSSWCPPRPAPATAPPGPGPPRRPAPGHWTGILLRRRRRRSRRRRRKRRRSDWEVWMGERERDRETVSKCG